MKTLLRYLAFLLLKLHLWQSLQKPKTYFLLSVPLKSSSYQIDFHQSIQPRNRLFLPLVLHLFLEDTCEYGNPLNIEFLSHAQVFLALLQVGEFDNAALNLHFPRL